MKNIILVILSILFSLSSLANTNQELMKLGHAAQQRLNEEEALKYYSQAIKDNPQNIEALSQASIMSANIGHRSSSSAVQNKYYNISLNYAQLALNINSNSDLANFAMAVIYARKVYTVTLPKARIELSVQIKKYAERTIKINPKHYAALTILGLWHYERATLTYPEKKIVAFIGGLPNGSLAQAKQYLEKSISIAPQNIATLEALGKVYHAANKKDQCISVWKKALRMTNQYQDDAARKKYIATRLSNI